MTAAMNYHVDGGAAYDVFSVQSSVEPCPNPAALKNLILCRKPLTPKSGNLNPKPYMEAAVSQSRNVLTSIRRALAPLPEAYCDMFVKRLHLSDGS